MIIEQESLFPLRSHITGMENPPKVVHHRYKVGDYVKYNCSGGFIIGRIIKLDKTQLDKYNYESYTMLVLMNKSKNGYTREFSFGGGCVKSSEGISELDAVTLGL